MKKLFAAIIAAALVMSLCACSKNNKVDEKVTMIDDIEDENKALREEIAEIENTITQLYFMNEINTNIYIANNDDEVRDNIYMGIETGYDVTVDDVYKGT